MRIAPPLLVLPTLGLALTLSFMPACGSSGSSGGFSCASPTSADSTCLSCANSSCSSQFSTASSDCGGALISCLESCNCGDGACQSKCVEASTQTDCPASGKAYESCIATMCSSECADASVLGI